MTDEERGSDGSSQEPVQGESAVRDTEGQENVYVKDWVRKIYLMMLTHPEVQKTGEYKPEFFVTRTPKRGMKQEYAELLSGDHATETGFYDAQRILMSLGVISESKDSQQLRRKINRSIIVKPESERQRPGYELSLRSSRKSSKKKETDKPTPSPPPPPPPPPTDDANAGGTGDEAPQPPTDKEEGVPVHGPEESKGIKTADSGIGLEPPGEPQLEKEVTGSSSLGESKVSFLLSGPPETLDGEMDLKLIDEIDELPEPPEGIEHQPTTPICLLQERQPRARIEFPNPSGSPITVFIY